MTLTDEFLQKAFQVLVFVGGILAVVGASGVWFYTKKLNGKTNSEIKRLIKENTDLISGGNSFGYLYTVGHINGKADVIFEQPASSTLPLYNLKIYFIEGLEELNAISEPRFTIEETSPKLIKSLGQIPFDEKVNHRFIIHFVARNQEWIEDYNTIYSGTAEKLIGKDGKDTPLIDIKFKVYKGRGFDGELLWESPRLSH